MKTPRAWYRVAAQAEADAADLYIFDVIGKSFWDDEAISQAKFLADVRALPDSVKTIRLHISSPGGNPFDAVTIANTLRNEVRARGRRIEVSIEGLAASAATIVAMAGDVIRMADNASFMIHEAQVFAVGPRAEMLRAVNLLETVNGQIITTYRWHVPLDVEVIAALMAETTWFTAEEARAQGFVDEIVPGMVVEARFDPAALAQLGTIPEAHRPRVEALIVTPAPPPAAASAAEVLRACTAGGCLDLAEGLIEAGAPLAEVQTRITAAAEARRLADARAKEITALCAAAKLPELAAGYVRGGMLPTEVKAHLITLTAKLDRVEIDGALSPDAGRAATNAALNPAAIYAARNQRS